LDAEKQDGVEVAKPHMNLTEMEYGLNMFIDCIENNSTPETALEDNFRSYAMVAAALESVRTGKATLCEQ
jgi:predicted dehydrogenase